VRNVKAVLSVLLGTLALAVLAGGVVAARYYDEIGLGEVGIAIGVGFLLALGSVSLARRAQFDFQRTLGRIGGTGVFAVGRFLGWTALLTAITAGLAFGVFAVLTLVLD
jgi:hypothetical protein